MQGQEVALERLGMRFGEFTAVEPTDLTIKAGEFFSILGPSGCGKTTILRMVSGFQRPSEGRVLIGGQDMTALPPNKRPTALIFQTLALFPLMTIWENVAFGLEAQGVPKAQRRKRAEELLDLVALGGQEEKRPAQLSGGQRQRVAVARALAVEPAVLLLDEPLSALDLKLRQHMRAELKTIQRRTGVTFIYITHDQGEALAMSDRVAVMRAGRVEQVGPTEEIYNRPATSFAATFVGENNLFRGKTTRAEGGLAEISTPFGLLRGENADSLALGEEAMLFIRPERLAPARPEHDLRLKAQVERADLEGPFFNLFLRAGDQRILLQLPNEGATPPEGEMELGFSSRDARVLRAGALAHG
ncbi:ABC transporter ATP-binding protein [Neomegalonema perideroedes]|uniref:ABC transporter ATP-binding protein n=1 Tax=Neomegalonema perideroedes TaxID=217219 RepID=UPI00036752C2|nr:ABC transporter ATP-binding protein [Neomegalonema perideroedes]